MCKTSFTSLQRKLLLSKSIDPDTLHEENLETTQIQMSTSLTPKSPVLEKDDDEPITAFGRKDGSRDDRGMTSSKSEGNVARMAKDQQDAGPLHFSDLTHDFALTAEGTPGTSKSATSAPRTAPPPYNHERLRARQRGGSSGSDGSQSQSSAGPYSRYQRGDGQGRESPPPYVKQLNSTYVAPERGSVMQDTQLNASYPGRAAHFQNGGGMSRQSSDSSVTSDPIYSTIPRKTNNTYTASSGNMPSRKPPFALNNETVNAMPRHSNSANFSSLPPPKAAFPKSMSADQLGASPKQSRKCPAPRAPMGNFLEEKAQNSDSEMASQYTPGNVRHLVQNYQKSVQQTRPVTPGVLPQEAPVPPPRRSRPLSAGPVRSTLTPNMNHSARAQSVTPDYIPSDNARPGSAKQLPARPGDGKAQQLGRPGSTLPRLNGNGTPEDKTNPNSVWYEYGCV